MVEMLIFMLAVCVAIGMCAEQPECMTANGKAFTWVATACSDKHPGCKDIFPYDAKAKKISPSCIATKNAKKLAISMCPNSCRLCCVTPEHNCEDNEDSPIPCERLSKAICEAKEMREFLAKNCPGTCGFCKESQPPQPSQPADDCPPDNASCPRWAANGYCKSPYYSIAEKRKSCGHICKLC
ncbi:shTK domain protein [Oesophagostomum dentatum]|uniref:ShTK domain protein n=1 Tax=Oesophagostomum dentatum TaxID=61180 RepID=A0A0B1S731_OESDE|nr:shTK domain protein [Oesophagostomum dentatum]